MEINKAIVTTSWDDGHKLDLRLAGLLAKYDIPATFYIAPKNLELAADDLLNNKQIVELSRTFEIGSHTMTHRVMTGLSPQEIASELRESRRYLATLTGQSITAFCYPRGIYNPQIVQAVRDAGYTYARTVERFSVSATAPILEAPTTLEAHRIPITHAVADVAKLAKINHYNPITTLNCLDWEVLAKTMLDHAIATGGVFHFWGHSWVVEQYDDWHRLERVLAYIASRRSEVNFSTNGELATRLQT